MRLQIMHLNSTIFKRNSLIFDILYHFLLVHLHLHFYSVLKGSLWLLHFSGHLRNSWLDNSSAATPSDFVMHGYRTLQEWCHAGNHYTSVFSFLRTHTLSSMK